MKNLKNKMKNLKNLRMSRRAVSPIIATLLLIAISVAAAVVTYTFTMNMVSNQGSQAQTAIRIDQVQFGQKTDTPVQQGIVVNIRNAGTVPALIRTIYVYQGGALVTSTDSISTGGNGYALAAGTMRGLYFKADSTTWNDLSSGGTTTWSAGSVPGTAETTMVTFNANLLKGLPYTIKIVTDNGFSIEGVFYAPSSFVVVP